MAGRLISEPIQALEDAVTFGNRPLDTDMRLWSDAQIQSELTKRSFVYREYGSYKIYGLEFENARRLLVALQSEYWAVLEEVNSRLRAWQARIAVRDRRIAELEVECAMRDERIAELEQLLWIAAPPEQAAQAQAAEWVPVEDGNYANDIYVDNKGGELSVFVNEEYGYAGVELPAQLRLCRRVPQPRPGQEGE